jgi:hypothetical protein
MMTAALPKNDLEVESPRMAFLSMAASKTARTECSFLGRNVKTTRHTHGSHRSVERRSDVRIVMKSRPKIK